MSKWRSRKLFAAIGAVVVVVLTNIGVPEDTAAQITDAITWVASAYLIGQGGADAAVALRKP